jgi:dienelactone hydrolase
MKKFIFSFAALLMGQVLVAQFQIGHTTITFNDPSRTGGFGSGGGPGRQIQTEIYYPAGTAGEDVNLSSGKFPVIVFGHGFAMGWDAYNNIWEELVPLGYIIAFPRTEGGLFPGPSHADFGLDLALVETKMENEGNLSSSLFLNHISNKSAIMGHSMGGGATFLGAENNTNITTVIGLAPAETTPSAIAAAANVAVPALVFTADEDMVTPAVNHQIPIYNGLGNSCKYLINIIGGAHCYYANANFSCDFGESTSGGNISITRTEQQVIMFRYLIPWLELYLYDDCDKASVFNTDLSLDAEVTYQSSCTGFPIPTYYLNVTTNGMVLTSNENSAVYQWINCDNGNSIIPSATLQTYTATQAGDYALILGTGSCADTSNCYTITAVGIDDLFLNETPKTLIKIVNYLGQETEFKLNTPLIYIYSDGTREKMVKLEF